MQRHLTLAVLHQLTQGQRVALSRVQAHAPHLLFCTLALASSAQELDGDARGSDQPSAQGAHAQTSREQHMERAMRSVLYATKRAISTQTGKTAQ